MSVLQNTTGVVVRVLGIQLLSVVEKHHIDDFILCVLTAQSQQEDMVIIQFMTLNGTFSSKIWWLNRKSLKVLRED